MKKLFILIAIVSIFSCQGQKKTHKQDTVFSVYNSPFIVGDSLLHGTSNGTYGGGSSLLDQLTDTIPLENILRFSNTGITLFNPTPRIDTLYALLVAVDTSSFEAGVYSQTTRRFHSYPQSFWMNGYVVVASYYSLNRFLPFAEMFVSKTGSVSQLVNYLDENKQPLSKNIIVVFAKDL